MVWDQMVSQRDQRIPPSTISHILTIVMGDQPTPNMPSDTGPEGQPEGRADSLLPNLNKASFS